MSQRRGDGAPSRFRHTAAKASSVRPEPAWARVCCWWLCGDSSVPPVVGSDEVLSGLQEQTRSQMETWTLMLSPGPPSLTGQGLSGTTTLAFRTDLSPVGVWKILNFDSEVLY